MTKETDDLDHTLSMADPEVVAIARSVAGLVRMAASRHEAPTAIVSAVILYVAHQMVAVDQGRCCPRCSYAFAHVTNVLRAESPEPGESLAWEQVEAGATH